MLGLSLITIVALCLLAWHYRRGRDRAEREAEYWSGQWIRASADLERQREGRRQWDLAGMNRG